MDQRHTHLIAAANALRGWVHAQKAARDGAAAPRITPLHMPAFVPVPSASAISVAEFDADLARFGEPEAAASVSRPSFDLGGVLVAALRGAGVLFGQAWPTVARFWKPAVASLAVLATIGVARSSWPQWSSAIKAQLRSAGEHVSVFDRPSRAPQPAPVATAKTAAVAGAGRRTGSLHVESNPEGAHVVIDGRDRGVTPLTLGELAVGSHAVVLKSDAGTVQRAVVISADKVTQLNEAIYSGWLHVSSSLDLQLSEHDRPLRLDDSNQVLLSPGSHELRFENRGVAFTDTRTIDVRPGDTTNISIEPPPSKLSVTASVPSEVLVDGTLIGGTPLTDFSVAVGTREIVVRSGAAERRQTIFVTVEPVSLAIDFER